MSLCDSLSPNRQARPALLLRAKRSSLSTAITSCSEELDKSRQSCFSAATSTSPAPAQSRNARLARLSRTIASTVRTPRTARSEWRHSDRQGPSPECRARPQRRNGRTDSCVGNWAILHVGTQPCYRREARPASRLRTTAFTMDRPTPASSRCAAGAHQGRLAPACPIAHERECGRCL
jgi:hypothetical protein